MYTQCPDCSVAFRVTADVLRQAAGKVRCGSCGNAFNALDYLSEQKPEPEVRDDSRPPLPELKPDTPDELEAGAPPKAISAEQSAALLKTLDQLAGEDIRIEDTGVEWRVLDDELDDVEPIMDEMPDSVTEMSNDEENDSPSIVDQRIAEIDDETHDEAVDDVGATGEMRFDDNTPLPEDFDFDGESSASSTPEERPPPADPEPEHPQVDLIFGDPEEWEDLLGEAAEEPPDSGIPAAAVEATEGAETTAEDAAADSDEAFEAPESPPDMDSQFASQAEQLGIDTSRGYPAITESAAIDDGPSDSSDDTSIDEDLIAAAFESEAAGRSAAYEAFEGDDDAEPEEPDRDADVPGADDGNDGMQAVAGDSIQVEETDDPDALSLAIDDMASGAGIDNDTDEDSVIEDLDMGAPDPLETFRFDSRFEDTATGDAAPASENEDADIPELSEEEETINMMIDQDLLAIAVEDEDGFASTIIQKQPVGDEENIPEDVAPEAEPEAEAAPSARNPLVETIIMEGEQVLAESDDDEYEHEEVAEVLAKVREAGRAEANEDEPRRRARSFGLAAGVVLLTVLLAVQVVHQSREALATRPALNDAIAPIYRALGQPITPSWNIHGWRFEATKGSTDDDEELLTIYSRIGNTSGAPLPYPLVHLSLTDRYEEIIGSKVLEPGDYLVGDPDPRAPVPPGENFNAVITIDSPSAAATGFKLNVCYGTAGGQLRCAVEDFK